MSDLTKYLVPTGTINICAGSEAQQKRLLEAQARIGKIAFDLLYQARGLAHRCLESSEFSKLMTKSFIDNVDKELGLRERDA